MHYARIAQACWWNFSPKPPRENGRKPILFKPLRVCFFAAYAAFLRGSFGDKIFGEYFLPIAGIIPFLRMWTVKILRVEVNAEYSLRIRFRR